MQNDWNRQKDEERGSVLDMSVYCSGFPHKHKLRSSAQAAVGERAHSNSDKSSNVREWGGPALLRHDSTYRKSL